MSFFAENMYENYDLVSVQTNPPVSIICNAMGHAAEREEKREKDDPSRDSNHTPSAIRADVLSS